MLLSCKIGVIEFGKTKEKVDKSDMNNQFSYKVLVREIRTGEETEVRIAERLYLDGEPLVGGYREGEAPAVESASETFRDELSLLSRGRECVEHFAGGIVYNVFPKIGLGDSDMQEFIRALKAAGIDVVVTTESRKVS